MAVLPRIRFPKSRLASLDQIAWETDQPEAKPQAQRCSFFVGRRYPVRAKLHTPNGDVPQNGWPYVGFTWHMPRFPSLHKAYRWGVHLGCVSWSSNTRVKTSSSEEFFSIERSMEDLYPHGFATNEETNMAAICMCFSFP